MLTSNALIAYYKQLPSERFLMIDRSYVVNIEYMETLKNHKICLRNGIELPVSQPKWPFKNEILIKNSTSIKKAFKNFTSKKMQYIHAPMAFAKL